jgi:glycogen phosphorylase
MYDLKVRGYKPNDFDDSNAELREVIDLILSGLFSEGAAKHRKPLLEVLLERDEYLLLADCQSYVDCQDQVSLAYRDPERWTRMPILNAAGWAIFSQTAPHASSANRSGR